MGVLRNPNHEKFAIKYVELGDATKAMLSVYPKRSGWSDHAKWVSASKLLGNPNITQRIQELQKKLKSKEIISAQSILELCTKVIGGEQITDFQEARGNQPSKARTIPKTWAIERVCKMLGLDKPTEVNVKTEPQLSREEMIKEIERLQKTRK